jgi:small basic protein (TIGR04137 family)
MSIHPSLAVSDKDKKQRSVMKRTERLKYMMDKGQWKEGDDVYGLPKIKALKLKVKKEKVEKAADATAAGAAAPAASASAAKAPAAKAPAAKAPAAKGAEKK